MESKRKVKGTDQDKDDSVKNRPGFFNKVFK
jgi:hypothetical protein